MEGETEIPIDQIIQQEQNPAQNFAMQQQMQQMQQMPVQGIPMPKQQNALGRVKEFFGEKADYIVAIPIFLVVVAIIYVLFPYLASRISILENMGRVLVSVLIGIIAAVIFLVIKSKTS
jgi:hypothetical protein